MSQKEHFTAGTGEGREERPAFDADIFGQRLRAQELPALVNNRDPKPTETLYSSERDWKAGNTDSIGSKLISPKTAQDLVKEAFFHPSMDQVPGIDTLRQTFDPQKNVHAIAPGEYSDAIRAAAFDPSQGAERDRQKGHGSGIDYLVHRRLGAIWDIAHRTHLESQVTPEVPAGAHAYHGVFLSLPGDRSNVSDITDIPNMNVMLGAVPRGEDPESKVFSGWDNPIARKLSGEEPESDKSHMVKLGTATHETAHALLHPKQFSGVDHQWPMARVHLAVVHALFGAKHAKALQDHYDRTGVNYGEARLPW